MGSNTTSLPSAIPGSHNSLSSSPLRIVVFLCLLSFLPELVWAIGLGLESTRRGLWPTFWTVATGIVFTVDLVIGPLAVVAAVVLAELARRFKQSSTAVLALMWLLVLAAAVADVAHLHGYIGLKRRVDPDIAAPSHRAVIGPALQLSLPNQIVTTLATRRLKPC